MDLSHLVSIGLFAAKRKPLSDDEIAYFKSHNLDKILADVVEQLAKSKPADPCKFIADAVSGKATAAPAAKGGKADAKPKAATAPAKSAAPAAQPAAAAGGDAEAQIKAVGDELRTLKEKLKAEGLSGAKINQHDEVKQLVAKLTALKSGGGAAAAPAKPAAPAPKPAAAAGGDNDAQIKAVGDELRALKEKLKSEGLSGGQINQNEDVKKLVVQLQALKSGGGAAPAAAPAKAAPEKPKPAKKDDKKAAPAKKDAVATQPSKGGGMDILKADDVPGWYEQVLMKGELIEQYPVKGCFILRPWAYRIWELVQRWLDTEIKMLGVQNCYFPMFIPKCYIEKEEDHLSDFAPELAWVSKFGDKDIDEPVAIRPTSETAMYAAYSNWVQSHRDLPIKLNQWCSVVRWEVKQTTPFLRTREFLWQEGHSAFANKKDAEQEVLDILELYALIYEKLLAVPCVRGTKTKAETFPGADHTTTVEAFIPATGRAIQGATSHHLGQNFSKMFDISFQDPTDSTGKLRDFAYQNSWGITQRTLGVMVMVHGDDKGLVLPPKVAGIQVVIVLVGIKASTTQEERASAQAKVIEYHEKLKQAGVRVELDERDYSPGWKFNYWEMKGVPLRLEVGPMDIKKGEFIMSKRNIPSKDGKVTGKDASMVKDVEAMLDTIQSELYEKALAETSNRIVCVDEWKDFSPKLNQGNLCLLPFCGNPDCEEKIKDKTKEEAADFEVLGGLQMGAKSLCVPHEEKYNPNCPNKCIFPDCCVTNVTKRTLFGRSY